VWHRVTGSSGWSGVSGHLAGVVSDLKYIEWDQATVPGLDVSGYRFREGRLRLSDRPGFGIDLDDELSPGPSSRPVSTSVLGAPRGPEPCRSPPAPNWAEHRGERKNGRPGHFLVTFVPREARVCFGGWGGACT
jgi:hypothetical protein